MYVRLPRFTTMTDSPTATTVSGLGLGLATLGKAWGRISATVLTCAAGPPHDVCVSRTARARSVARARRTIILNLVREVNPGTVIMPLPPRATTSPCGPAAEPLGSLVGEPTGSDRRPRVR